MRQAAQSAQGGGKRKRCTRSEGRRFMQLEVGGATCRWEVSWITRADSCATCTSGEPVSAADRRNWAT